MLRAAQAGIAVGMAIFGFDVEIGAPPSRALQILTIRRALPKAGLEARERFIEAALRIASGAGVDLGGRRMRGDRLRLVGLDDQPGRGARTVTAWYYATAAVGETAVGASWSSVGRGLRLDARDTAA